MMNKIRKISALIMTMVLIMGLIPVQVKAENISTLNALEIKIDTVYDAVITNEVKEIWYKFTPEESGAYSLLSEGDVDTVGEFYDENLNFSTENDDGGNGNNFMLQAKLEAGKTYYYKARLYNEENNGSFKVKIVKNVPATDMILNNYTLELCEKDYTFLEVSFEPELAIIESVNLTSSDSNVAVIDEYGQVAALSSGTAIITAESENGLKKTCTVTVNKAKEISLNQDVAVNVSTEYKGYESYAFTPEKTGIYRIFSVSENADPSVQLMDSEGEFLDVNYGSTSSNDFSLDYELTAGETYYYIVKADPINNNPTCTIKIIEITPTVISDIYFTVDGIKEEQAGFSITNGQKVQVAFKLNKGNDLEDIQKAEVVMSYCDMGGSLVETSAFASYNADTEMYYADLPDVTYTEGRMWQINNLYLSDKNGCEKSLYDYNQNTLNSLYFYMGDSALSVTKNYEICIDVAGNINYVEVTSAQITSLSKMNITLPEIPEINGVAFKGWQLDVDYNEVAFITSDEQQFDYKYNFENIEDSYVELSAVFDKRIVDGIFKYCDENGEIVTEKITTPLNNDKSYTYGQWLEIVKSEGLLDDIKHGGEYAFGDWEIDGYNPEDTINTESYIQFYVYATYPIEGIILGGNNLTDGMYLNNAGEISETKPEGGYAFYDNGKLELNNYKYVGEGIAPLDYAAALYMDRELEITLIGDNLLHCLDDDAIYSEEGNLTISGEGQLQIISGDGTDGIDINDGDVNIKSGNIYVLSEDHGLEIEGNLIIDDGIIKINAGDEGFDVDGDIVINGGIIDIEADDKGIDTSDNLYIHGGVINLRAENDNGFEASEDIVIDGGTIFIEAGEYGIYAYESVSISDAVINIKSGSGALYCDYDEFYGNCIDTSKISQDENECYVSSDNGQIIYNIILSADDSADYKFIEHDWINISQDNISYDGTIVKPEVTVTNSGTGEILTENTDYKITWLSGEIKEPGSYYAVLEALGDYQGYFIIDVVVYEDYVYIGDVKLAGGQYLISGETDTVEKKPVDSGYAYYKNGILKLYDFEYSGTGYLYDSYYEYSAGIYALRDIRIELYGNNKIENTSEDSDGITGEKNIVIAGNGNLNIVASYGIYAVNDSLYIDSGILDINSSTTGIYADTDVSISGGLVDIVGENGISAYYDINIYGGFVNINVNETAAEFYDINLANDVNIEVPENATTVTEDNDCSMIADAEGNVATTVVISGDIIKYLNDSINLFVGEETNDIQESDVQYIKEIADKLLENDIFDDAEKEELNTIKAQADDLLKSIGGNAYLTGDVNSDKKIDAQDALLVLKHAAKLSELSGNELKAADVTFDEMVNASDALDILKYAAKLISKFEK